MSGHSKWKQIKNKKGVADAKKGAIFTRLSKIITLAAREGGDPNMNFKLATAIDQARSMNMPKDNIERAIKRGTGEEASAQLHEVLYEGYGPEGVALIIIGVTDNVNRTVSDVRTTLTKHGGSMATAGAVRWNFEQKGVIRLENVGNRDELELMAIDAGADDIREEEDGLLIATDPKNLQSLKQALEKQGIKSEYAAIEFLPKSTVALSESGQIKLEKLTNALDDLEDVQDYYTNAV
ncbi:MAG: YebC/PmpR family DNA-binding transcriptional regulator [Candidatus Komeilibacteria bacterium]|nr:YebC/PmpR family DNA-binding transcriptional regulator [Candidatus Komeilibacteria bacterium]